MRYADVRQLVDQAVEFPVDHDALIEQLGEVELTAPTGDSATIGEILETSGDPAYDSAEVLYATIVGNLDDTFIGRKFYDDRAGVHDGPPDDRPARTL